MQAGVYEETGDLRLANMARSGTSLLVYGGLAYADARIGMSGIRQWRTPKIIHWSFSRRNRPFRSQIHRCTRGKEAVVDSMRSKNDGKLSG